MALAAAAAGALAAPVVSAHPAAAASKTFSLLPAGKTLACLAAPGKTPKATATVVESGPNQTMTLNVSGIKPGLDFDLFTVEKSPFNSAGKPNPAFDGRFGLAWYQSDLEVGSSGTGSVKIRTILNPEIFGFDANTGLKPTHTFHVGFWFNDPDDAAACGFTGFTPFNGEQHAGPVAMITKPGANGKGPLG
jgi:hypothetical protein